MVQFVKVDNIRNVIIYEKINKKQNIHDRVLYVMNKVVNERINKCIKCMWESWLVLIG